VHFGTGGNGKGWWDAVLGAAFGSYACHPGISLLSSVWPGADKPAPNLLGMRGRRFVIIPETERKSVIIAGQFKSLRDHKSRIEARALYQGVASFALLQLSTNVVPEWTSLDGGVQRSLAVVEWPFNFRDDPQPGTNQRRIDTSLKRDGPAKQAAELVLVLLAVDKAWGKDVDSSRVLPQPLLVQKATAKFLHNDEEDQVAEFLRERTTVVVDPSEAATDAKIGKRLREYLGPGTKVKDAREALEKHTVLVRVRGAKLLRPIGKQAGYIALTG